MTALAVIVPLVIAVVGVPFILLGEKYRLAHGWVSWVLGIHWILIIYLSWLIVRGPPDDGTLRLPKVRTYQKKHGYLMVEALPWLGQGQVVSIYRLEDQFERFLFPAEVENIQANGLAALIPLIEPHADLTDELIDLLDRNDLSDIMIKPGIRRFPQ